MADKFSTASKGVPVLGGKRLTIDQHFLFGFETGKFIVLGTNKPTPIAFTAGEGGSFVLTTAGASADGAFVRTTAAFNFNRANEVWEFSTKVKFSEANLATNIFAIAGVPASDAALIASGLVDGVGYVKPTGATAIALQDLIGSVDQGGNANVGTQDATAHWLKLVVRTGNTTGVGNLELYRDGTLLGTLTGVTLPTATNLCIIIGNQAGEAAAKTCTIYRIFVNVPDPNAS